jgi:hypothetical protein
MATKQTSNSSRPKAKPVQPPVLVLPNPHRISGDTDAMLESTVAERFKTILLVKTSDKDTSKGQAVLTHTPDTNDSKVQVNTWNTGLGHLLRFLQAGINAWFSGAGLSGDGSAVYVAKYADKVFKTVPQLKNYDVFVVPNGRSGASKYRISVQELVAQVTSRASIVSNSVKEYGIAQGKERTKKAESAPEITTIL